MLNTALGSIGKIYPPTDSKEAGNRRFLMVVFQIAIQPQTLTALLLSRWSNKAQGTKHLKGGSSF